MADRLKALFTNEVNDLKVLLTEAARSGTYLYPFQGILYFFYHRSLWQPLISKIGPTITLGLAVTTTMFFFTYIPQVAILAFTSGPLAPFSAILLVLSESSTITNYLSRSFILRDSLVDTFDGTLIARGEMALVAEGRQIKGSTASDPVARLGDVIRKPTKVFSFIVDDEVVDVSAVEHDSGGGNGVLKGWDGKRREAWVSAHKAAYTSFGAAAFVLEMVPFASLAFSYTNTVGGALWASNLEKSIYRAPTMDQMKKLE
ncbi:hypothetical protein PAAG_12398 [Paracoccidioides lutzii Pb01]|uniref:Uncharacterized protein n=1 Tax=Paracoccidioides lutzii (strain ATCC MYA-826 / Pb01) TaxID=502779 RepID=A0A0A2V085_PARBA|nr:hypothetical protein PAAG_12398 [Paracoccidioides lutzii Pb01]KGQ00928.1 hypothetical protein PAAG_12398 [Paracoccidioides lutzii Pb01]